ncbi:hypothetical protein ABT167_30535 [Streptomyces sp. NPDC001792]|uniref:hypothetical protein n=1 Tax=Streptomyces sp. NPDC001792 TaxID=3154524 RepID=UPI003325055B
MSVDVTSGRVAATELRTEANGGCVRLPYLVALLDADGNAVPVPVEKRGDTADGTLVLTGETAGFHARSVLAPPTGPAGLRDTALTVTRTGEVPVIAGLRVEVQLGTTDDPAWLVPGLFYGENRVPDCDRVFPRFQAGAHDPDAMVSHTWVFRADRCATPAVFARDTRGGAVLVTGERSELGLSGVGLSLDPKTSRPALRLHFPYREEPVVYYGSAQPLPAEAQLHTWQPGESRTVTFRVGLLGADPHAYAPVLREVHERNRPERGPAAWVGLGEAADLTACGLYLWHYRPDPPVLLETAAFDGEALGERGDQQAMHVGWVSGVPYAYAVLRHARRTGRVDYRKAAEAGLDHIAGNLAPGGTFWGQWTASRGWTTGWHSDRDRLHVRTLAEATLFMLRALTEERRHGSDHPAWEHAVRSNLAVALATQDADGHLGSAYHQAIGAVLSRAGAAGLTWVPALVEAAQAFGLPGHLEAARRAGRCYGREVRPEFLCGAPEDVDLAPTSEDGCTAVMAYTALLEADGTPEWLDLARRSADWTLTFRYTYDVEFSPRTLLGRYGFRSRGGDQASPSNQHLHSYGLVCLPEMARLARRSGDRYYLESTRENLDCFRQFVAREDGDFDAYRGMVGERFCQTSCFQAKGMLLTLSHAWCAGLLLYAAEAALELPGLADRPEGGSTP